MKTTIKMRGKIVLEALSPLIKEGDLVLDVGAGEGIISHMIVERFNCEIIKIDKGDKVPDYDYDAVLFISSLHHMELPEQVGYITKLLKCSKQIIIFEAEPSLGLFMIDRFMGFTHGENDCPLRHQTMREWGFIAEQCGGFAVSSYLPVPWYYPHNQTLTVIKPNRRGFFKLVDKDDIQARSELGNIQG